MRSSRSWFILIAGAGFVLLACSAQGSGDQTMGSGGGDGGAGLVHCQVEYVGDPDDDLCRREHCCAELSACMALPNCLSCGYSGALIPECSAVNSARVALRNCGVKFCSPDSGL